MIESKCPTCGGKVISPDPPESVLTPKERIQFEKDWDAMVAAAKARAEED